jgi:hypothetical protein
MLSYFIMKMVLVLLLCSSLHAPLRVSLPKRFMHMIFNHLTKNYARDALKVWVFYFNKYWLGCDLS